MLIASSEKYKLPIDFYIAVGALESNLGTKGRGAVSHNPYNVGNVTWADGLPAVCGFGTTCLSDWEQGIENFASLIGRCYFNEGEEIKIDTWIERNFIAQRCNIKGKRYMYDKQAKQKYLDILPKVRQILS